MAFLVAYLDDSGTHKNSTLVSVAGAISSRPQWTKFSRTWNRQLRRWNVEIFRMADFVSNHGPFKGWGQHKKSYVLSELVRTIKTHARVLVGSAVRTEDFDAAFAKYPNPCIRDAYHFCAVSLLPEIGDWALKSQARGPVDLTFESGNKLFDQYFRLIQEDFAQEGIRNILGIDTLSLATKKLAIPLQAADVTAYATYKCRIQRSIEPYLQKAYSSLFEMKNIGRVWKREQVEQILEKVLQDLTGPRAHLYETLFSAGRKLTSDAQPS